MNNPKNNGLVVPSREMINEQHLSILLTALREMQPYLLAHPLSDPLKDRPDLDGGVKESATVTAMKILSRIDEIVEEKSRWSMNSTTDFYAELTKTQLAQQEFLHEQSRAAKMVQLPQYQLRPTLMRDETNFFAVWGDGTKAGGAIIGKGITPKAALEDFDAAFERTPAEQLTLILEQDNPPELPPE